MLSERFNWDRLRVFRLVADAQSMTSAARALGESTPTVSRRINDLERDLGTKLFLRSKRGVELTAAGKRLKDLVLQMQTLVDDVGTQIAHDDRTAAGAIKLKASDGLGPYWIARHLPEFHRNLPNVQIDLEIGLAEHEVVDREADLAIVYEQPNHPEIISQRLGTLHYICYASQDYIDRYGKPTNLYEFKDHKLLMHTDYVHQVERWSKNVKQVKEFIDYSTITNSSTALKTLCEYGGGIAVLPSYVSLLDTNLVPLSLPSAAPIQFWITYTERVRRNPAGMAALDWMLSIFNEAVYPHFGSTFLHPKQIPTIEPRASSMAIPEPLPQPDLR
ncbi:MAG: LysR family transcriptional regulator [Henriciella sp.]